MAGNQPVDSSVNSGHIYICHLTITGPHCQVTKMEKIGRTSNESSQVFLSEAMVFSMETAPTNFLFPSHHSTVFSSPPRAMHVPA